MANRLATGTLRLVGSFLAGIVIYFAFGGGFSWAGEAAAFFTVLFLVLWRQAQRKPLVRYRRWAGLAGMLAVASFSLWACFLKNSRSSLPVPESQITHYKVTLVKAVALKPKSGNTVGRVEAVRAAGKWYPAQGQVVLFFPRHAASDTLRYGAQLLMAGPLTEPAPPANPYQFDYRRYLQLKHIQWQAYVPQGNWQQVGYDPPNWVTALSLHVRKTLEKAFKETIKAPREVTIAHALVLGVQDDLDATLRDAYARTGTMHVLAVSGLHVGLLYGVLLFFLKHARRGKSGRLLVLLLVVGVIWFYAFVTGLSASVLRSVCMFTLVEFGKWRNKKASVLNTLAVVALALLLYDPNYLLDVGFQLSFLAVAGIVVLQPVFLRLWKPTNPVTRFFWELLAISIAAQLATLPLSLYYFHQFPVYFWVANLFAVPFTTVALYIGVAFMAFFYVPLLGDFLGFLLEKILWMLNELLLWLENWPGSVLDGFVITPGQVFALYLFMGAVFLFLLRRRLSWLALSGLCLAFISATELAEARRQRQSTELLIHSVRKSSAVSVVQGRQVTFLADSVFQAQPQLFAYQVQPYWWAKGVRKTYFGPGFEKTAAAGPFPFSQTSQGNTLLVWQGKKLLWLKKLPKHLPQPLALDALVLQHNVWSPADKLAASFMTRTVLLDQTNGRRYTQKKAQELKAAGYRVHVLEEDGAFHLRLKQKP